MCGCKQGTCFGGCPCGCTHTPPPGVRYLRDHRGFVGVPDPENHDSSARPVVVIDPEDREQVGYLAQRFCGRQSHQCFANVTTMQDALRSLIAPPLPPEPTGPAARVADREGDEWALVGGNWVCEHGGVPRDWVYLVSECGPLEVRP